MTSTAGKGPNGGQASVIARKVSKGIQACARWLGRVLLAAIRGFNHAVRRGFRAVRDFLGLRRSKNAGRSVDSRSSSGSARSAGKNASSGRWKARQGVRNPGVEREFGISEISQGFIGSVLGPETDESSVQKTSVRKSTGTNSRPVAKSVYRVRRIAVLVMALVVVIAIIFGCRAAISAISHRHDSAAYQDSSQVSQQHGSQKPDGKSKPPKPNQAEMKLQEPLSDQTRAAMLAKAQATVATSGKPAHQYSYCVSTKGDVGGSKTQQEFENSIFRTLNDPRGWPRAGATFTYSSDSSSCDFVIYLSQPTLMTLFSGDCSDEYSCRVGDNVIINEDRWNGATPQMLKAGMSLSRYRIMVINHEVGHRLGHIDNDPSCPAPKAPAPLMQEQSMSLRGCKPNEWPTDSELWIQ